MRHANGDSSNASVRHKGHMKERQGRVALTSIPKSSLRFGPRKLHRHGSSMVSDTSAWVTTMMSRSFLRHSRSELNTPEDATLCRFGP